MTDCRPAAARRAGRRLRAAGAACRSSWRAPPTAPASCSSRSKPGRAVESVIIPDPPRLTACISSQAGCAMGCAFCATARLGLQRNLSAAEIAGQLVAVRARARSPASGSPTSSSWAWASRWHNYDAVVEAIEILTAAWGFGLSGRRITVSTVGLLPQLERLVRETAGQHRGLAHRHHRRAARPAHAGQPPLSAGRAHGHLPRAADRAAPPHHLRVRAPRRRQRLRSPTPPASSRLLHGIRAKVNLIPFNPFPGAGFAPPAAAVVAGVPAAPARRPASTPPSAPPAAATSRPPAASSRADVTCLGRAERPVADGRRLSWRSRRNRQ